MQLVIKAFAGDSREFENFYQSALTKLNIFWLELDTCGFEAILNDIAISAWSLKQCVSNETLCVIVYFFKKGRVLNSRSLLSLTVVAVHARRNIIR